MMSTCGWLIGFDINSNYLHIHLVDKYRRRISVRDWNTTVVPDHKLGCKVFLSGFKKTSVFEKTELTVYGPILYFNDEKYRHSNIDQLQQLQQYVIEDLSTIDYDEEFEKAKNLTIHEVITAVTEGGYGNNSFYRLDDVVIQNVTSFFRITNKYKERISAGWEKGTVIDAKTGNDRNLKKNR